MKRVVTMRKFNQGGGRWGNQVISYAALRCYALEHNCEIQIPAWPGNYLFGHNDPPISERLPDIIERRRWSDLRAEPLPFVGDELIGRNVIGWFQVHTEHYRPHKEFIQSLFCRDAHAQHFVNDLRSRGKTLVAIHVRRTDQGRFNFYRVPTRYYLRFLHHQLDAEDPVFFLASDEKACREEFASVNPLMIDDLTVLDRSPMSQYDYLEQELEYNKDSLQWYPEWYIMQHADVIVAGNSTFAFSAGWTNQNLTQYWRWDLPRRNFVLEDVWDTLPLLHTHCELYKDISGVCVEESMWYGTCKSCGSDLRGNGICPRCTTNAPSS